MMAADNKQISLHESIANMIDVQMLLALMILCGIGITMMTSTTVEIGYKSHADAFFYVKQQMMFLLLGALCILAIARIRRAYWEQLGPLLLMATIVLLVLVLIPGLGTNINGSSRWIALGPISLQVSEFTKVAMIIYLSGYIVRHGSNVQQNFSAFINPMALVSIIAVLLMMEPDFGSTVVLAALVFTMLYLGGVRLAPFILSTAFSVLVMYFLARSNEERWSRVTTFWRPFEDPLGDGFQLTQALIAIGNGGIFGEGLGGSIQKLFYLTEAHNDFVFSVLAEELGLIGIAILLCAYFVFIWRCFSLASSAQKQHMTFAQNIAYGCGVWFTLQATIHVGVNMGLLPTKGLSMPFISVGGSNLLASCIAVGLLVRVYLEVNQQGARRVHRRRRNSARKAG
jgi:cell division protein FtsW